jgi:hypothetical protein
MENIKDNSIRTNLSIQNKAEFSSFIMKRTEKLVTALYMVTDCMESEDSIKGRLRHIGVGLLSTTQISNSNIQEIISLLNIASVMGYISEMNTSILKAEFISLQEEFEKYEEPPLFPSNFWDVEPKGQIKDSIRPLQPIGQNIAEKRVGNIISQVTSKSFFDNKEERKHKILALIKDKKEVSIKDISIVFSDCSEKTIQRELNTLVALRQIKKVGEKRWSRYHSL